MLRSLLRSVRVYAPLALFLAAALARPSLASASSPFLIVPAPADVETTAAYRYANMTNEEAIAELNRRNLPYVTVDPVPGVRAPIRLTGRLHGVHIHSALSPEQRATSPFEILDARLALALDDFAAILEKHDIDEVVHYTMYRPNVSREIEEPKPNAKVAPPVEKPAPEKPAKEKPSVEKHATRGKPTKTSAADKHPPKEAAKKPEPKPVKKDKPLPAPAEKTAKPTKKPALGKAVLGPKTAAASDRKPAKQKGPGDKDEADKPVVTVEAPLPKKNAPATNINPAWAPPGTRHPAGLAIDVGKLRKKDGTWISVLDHFQGKIGDKVCGEGAPVPESAQAKELRAIVCEALGEHVFTYVLTPNYNAAHADHFHMEIKPGVKWFLVH